MRDTDTNVPPPRWKRRIDDDLLEVGQRVTVAIGGENLHADWPATESDIDFRRRFIEDRARKAKA